MDERGLPPLPNSASSNLKVMQLHRRQQENRDSWNRGGASVLDGFGRQEKTGIKRTGEDPHSSQSYFRISSHPQVPPLPSLPVASYSGSGPFATPPNHQQLSKAELAERRRLRVTTLEANELQTELDAIKRDREFAKALQGTNPTPRQTGLAFQKQAVSFVERPTATISPHPPESTTPNGNKIWCYCCGRAVAQPDVASYVAPATIDAVLQQMGAPPAAGRRRAHNTPPKEISPSKQLPNRLDAKSNWRW